MITAWYLGALMLAQSETVEGWRFDPIQKRDPFIAPLVDVQVQVPEVLRWEVGEMRLVAVISGMGPARAMLLFPNGMSAVVREGEQVGRRRGLVAKIAPTEILIRNKLLDNRNQEYVVEDRLILAQ